VSGVDGVGGDRRDRGNRGLRWQQPQVFEYVQFGVLNLDGGRDDVIDDGSDDDGVNDGGDHGRGRDVVVAAQRDSRRDA
jgi:hypothetical protein